MEPLVGRPARGHWRRRHVLLMVVLVTLLSSCNVYANGKQLEVDDIGTKSFGSHDWTYRVDSDSHCKRGEPCAIS